LVQNDPFKKDFCCRQWDSAPGFQEKPIAGGSRVDFVLPFPLPLIFPFGNRFTCSANKNRCFSRSQPDSERQDPSCGPFDSAVDGKFILISNEWHLICLLPALMYRIF
jgi:hypothetical protein